MSILCIETGTDVCSVGLVLDGQIVALRESVAGRDHARWVALFAQEVMEEAGITAVELDAVAVSKGPGSYTGLRIGVSFAKGLCCGLGIPLIGIGSLESLCEGVQNAVSASAVLLPMIDARRMEVYAQVFGPAEGALGEFRALGPVEAVVVNEGSFSELRDRAVVIFGSGAEKCREVLPWMYFIDVQPSVRGMARLATEAFAARKFEDTAYFEPFYLKDFVATTPKKNIL